MATREDNLKAINAEREQLSDEELDQIAGGTMQQVSDDSKFLNVLLRGRPARCDRYEKFNALLYDREITYARKSVGIEFIAGADVNNEYLLNGKEISRSAQLGRTRKKSSANIRSVPTGIGNNKPSHRINRHEVQSSNKKSPSNLAGIFRCDYFFSSRCS